MSRRVAIAGASGLIGSALSTALRARGDTVVSLVRRPARGPLEVSWDPGTGVLAPTALDGVDAVVNLAGAGVGDRRWTSSYKRLILSSRIATTSTLARAVAAAPAPPRFVVGTAVGYYGDRGDELLTEDSSGGDGFLADVVRAWEAAAAPALEAGAATAFARTGLVLSPDGGAAAPLVRLARFGLAGPLGPGSQYWPWITLADEVRALLFLLDGDLTGPVNLTGPAPARQRDVAAALGRSLHRPAFLPAPGFALRLALGEFAGDVLASQRVLPERLLADGFAHEHPTLERAVDWLVASGRS